MTELGSGSVEVNSHEAVRLIQLGPVADENFRSPELKASDSFHTETMR